MNSKIFVWKSCAEILGCSRTMFSATEQIRTITSHHNLHKAQLQNGVCAANVGPWMDCLRKTSVVCSGGRQRGNVLQQHPCSTKLSLPLMSCGWQLHTEQTYWSWTTKVRIRVCGMLHTGNSYSGVMENWGMGAVAWFQAVVSWSLDSDTQIRLAHTLGSSHQDYRLVAANFLMH